MTQLEQLQIFHSLGTLWTFEGRMPEYFTVFLKIFFFKNTKMQNDKFYYYLGIQFAGPRWDLYESLCMKIL